MILSARILDNVGTVNDFKTVSVSEFTEGDAFDLYFQLIDATEKLEEPSSRYMPPATSILSATVDNINAARQVTRSCTNPFSNDLSIWKLSILSTDGIKGTSNLKLVLTEPGSVIKRGLVKNALRASTYASI